MSKKNPDAAKNIAGKILKDTVLAGVFHRAFGAGVAAKVAIPAAAGAIAMEYRQEIANALAALKTGIGNASQNAPDLSKEIERTLRQDLEKNKDKFTPEEYTAAETMIPALVSVFQDVVRDKRTFAWVLVVKKDGTRKYHRMACNNVQFDQLPRDGSVKVVPIALSEALRQNIEEASDCNHMDFDAQKGEKEAKEPPDPIIDEIYANKLHWIKERHKAAIKEVEDRESERAKQPKLVLPKAHWTDMFRSSSLVPMTEEDARKHEEDHFDLSDLFGAAFEWLAGKFRRKKVSPPVSRVDSDPKISHLL